MRDSTKIKDLFIQALDIADPQERLSMLDRACSDDAELRKRLDALLAAHETPAAELELPLAFGLDAAKHDPSELLAGAFLQAATNYCSRSAKAGWESCGWPNRTPRCVDAWRSN